MALQSFGAQLTCKRLNVINGHSGGLVVFIFWPYKPPRGDRPILFIKINNNNANAVSDDRRGKTWRDSSVGRAHASGITPRHGVLGSSPNPAAQHRRMQRWKKLKSHLMRSGTLTGFALLSVIMAHALKRSGSTELRNGKRKPTTLMTGLHIRCIMTACSTHGDRTATM